MRRVAALAVLLLTVVGCSAPTADAQPAPVTITVTATPTPEPSPEAECTATLATNQGAILAEYWSIVMDSRTLGPSTHERYYTEFADAVKDFSDDVQDDDACSDYASAAANLNLAVVLLKMLVINEEADNSDYDNVAAVGDTLAETLGEDDVTFQTS